MNKINILVVDDRPEGILAIQAVLSSPSYNIVTAASGTEALKALLSDDFAVILMDVQMPIMNGFETAAVIKTREKSKDIPIIFMSAINQDEQYVYQGYGVGAVDYLLKPFDPYILRSKVSIFVDLYLKNLVIREQTKKLYESEIKTYTQAIDRLELESLRRFQSLANSIPQLVCRINIDGTADYFNKAWFAYTGLDEAKSSELGWQQSFHKDDLMGIVSSLSLDKNSANTIEARIKGFNGKYRWHQIQFEAETYHETRTTWLITAMDIEDRKAVEDNQRFLAEAGALLVSSLDYEDTVQTIAKLTIPHLADWCSFDICIDGELKNLALLHRDSSKQDLIEQLYSRYMSHPEADFGLRRVIKTGQTIFYENIDNTLLSGIALDQHQLDLALAINDRSAVIVPLKVKGDTIGAITLALSDSGRHYDNKLVDVAEELGRRAALAYENSRLYKVAQEAVELRNDFLSIASHELNTPITSLKLQLQMTDKVLRNTDSSDVPVEKFKRSVEGCVKQVDRLINLVQVLLDVSRIQSGKFTFSFEEVNLNHIISEIIERQKEILNNSNCILDFKMNGDALAIVDKTRIEQVMVNLLTNTIKYAPGKIDLNVEVIDEQIRIIFRDHGNGIPEHKLKKIFDRFERATSNQSVGGLGLGLYIVKQIVEGHQGEIQVESKQGEGTVFTITIPQNATLSDLHLETIN